jgi:hypothetical protein
MKKIGFILMSMFLTAIVFQSCEDDQTGTGDPRDAIAKEWTVTEDNSTVQPYNVTISKDATESTKVWFENFHQLGASEKVYGILQGSIIDIPNQTTTGDYTISGEGTIVSSTKITFEYSVAEGADPAENFTSTFGPVIPVKKALVVASN